EVVHLDAMRHSPVQHCFRINRGADGERLDDVAGHRLADRGIVEDPVEIRGVPQRGKTDRRGFRRVVLWLKQRGRQEKIAAPMNCIQAAEAGFSRLLRCAQLGLSRNEWTLAESSRKQVRLSRSAFGVVVVPEARTPFVKRVNLGLLANVAASAALS